MQLLLCIDPFSAGFFADINSHFGLGSAGSS